MARLAVLHMLDLKVPRFKTTSGGYQKGNDCLHLPYEAFLHFKLYNGAAI